MARETDEAVAIAIGLSIAASTVFGLWWYDRRPPAVAHDEPPAMDASTPPKAVTPDAAVSARCEAFLDANHRVLDEAREDDADCDLRLFEFEDASFCVEGPRALWGLRFTTLLKRPQEGDGHPCAETGIEARLVHIDADGHETSTVPSLAEEWDDHAGHDALVNLSGSMRIDPPEAFDFDGDGDLEIFIAGNRSEEDVDATTREIFTFRAGAIGPFAPVKGLDFDHLEDIDSDGRPDLIGRGPYAKVQAMDMSSPRPIAPFVFAAHSLVGGEFSTADAVAREFTRTQCPISPTPVFADGWMEGKVSQDIVCMRAWGVPREVVERALDARCKTYEESPTSPDACPRWSKELAAIAPPFAL